MIIVLLVLGIVVALGFPLLSASVTDAKLTAAVNEITAACEFAQLSAMNTGRACRITVDAATETVSVEQLTYAQMDDIIDGGTSELDAAAVETNVAYAAMEHPLTKGDYIVDLSASGAEITASTAGPGSPIAFDALGAPSGGGQVIVAYGGRSAAILVDAFSGKVTPGGA